MPKHNDETIVKTSAALPPRLSRDQFDAIRSEVEKHKEAQRGVMEALGVLWQRQYEVAVRMGDVETVNRVMSRPLALWDDCNCC